TTGTMLSISATAASTRTGIAGFRTTRTLPSTAIARARASSEAALVRTRTGRADPLRRSHTVLGRADVEAAALESALQEPALLVVSLGDQGAQMAPETHWPGFAPGTGGGVDRIRSIADGAPNLDHRGHHGETAPFPPV